MATLVSPLLFIVNARCPIELSWGGGAAFRFDKALAGREEDRPRRGFAAGLGRPPWTRAAAYAYYSLLRRLCGTVSVAGGKFRW